MRTSLRHACILNVKYSILTTFAEKQEIINVHENKKTELILIATVASSQLA